MRFCSCSVCTASAVRRTAGGHVGRRQRSTLLGVAAALCVTGATTTACATSNGCGGAGALTPTTISGPVTRVNTYGQNYTIQGTGPAGSTVDVAHNGTWNFDVVAVVEVPVPCSGRWTLSETAVDDYRFWASHGTFTTPTYRALIAPTISGGASHTVPKNSTYTIRGTGAPGQNVTVHVHKPGTPANDYSTLRTAYVSDGAWSTSLVVSGDTRFYATLPNGLRSSEVRLQAR